MGFGETLGGIPIVGGVARTVGLAPTEQASAGTQYGSYSDAEYAAAQKKYEEDLARWEQNKKMEDLLGSGRYSAGPAPVPPSQTGFRQSAFQLGNQYTQQFGVGGGVADQYGSRQIDPALQQMLLAQANGSAPSAAQIQMQDALRRNQAMAMGMAQSNPNVSPAQAMRMAMQSQNQMGLQSQAQMAALRAQEQQQGQQMYANYMLNQQNQNDQMVRYFQSLGYSMDEAQMKAGMALQGMQFQAHESQQNRNLAAQQANMEQQANQDALWTSMVATGAGSLVKMSGAPTPSGAPAAGQTMTPTPGGGLYVQNANFVE